MVCIAKEYASGSFGVGLGWGGGNNVHVNLKICHVTLWDILSLAFAHVRHALALAHIRHATLWDLLLHLHYAYLCLGGGGWGGVGHVNVP